MIRKLQPVIVFIVILIAVLIGRQLVSAYALDTGITSYSSHMMISIVAKIVIIIAALIFIKRYHLEHLAGLSKKQKLSAWGLLIFPLYLVILNALFSDDMSAYFNYADMLWLIAYCIVIGFSEELGLRGFLQSYLIKEFATTQKGIKWAAFSAAFIFGVLHVISFTKGFYGEIAQVFFATFIGFMFGAILLRTKRLYPLIIIHTLIDFAAKFDDIGTPKVATKAVTTSDPSALILIAIVLPCFFYGLVLLRKVTPETIAVSAGDK